MMSADELQLLPELRRAPQIFTALVDVRPGETEFHLQRRLRREFSEPLVRAALTLRDLRKKARKKFTRAEQMWFTTSGLEQATAEPIARHKMRRFEGPVWDFCCGIGGDTLALAERCEVRAVDRDPAMCLRAEWNAEVYGVRERVQTMCCDVSSARDCDGLLHIDPDRRPGGRQRVLRIEDCSPGLDLLRQLTREFRGGAIKLSPASNFGGKFPGTELELISLRFECKEATVWFGELAGCESFRATSLPSGETIAGDPLSASADVCPPNQFIFDPDPAIVRSGLLELLAVQLQLSRLDSVEEYLTGESLLRSPWLQSFRLLDVVPNNDREVRQACRTHGFGSVEIKCRHLTIDVERTRRKLPLDGSSAGVLIFARVQGQAQVLVCRRVQA